MLPNEVLKRCPFCGAKAELLIVPGKASSWVVKCAKGCSNTCQHASAIEAAEAWNRRDDGAEKIRIGDEVCGKDAFGNIVFVVTRVLDDGWLYGIGHDGIPYLDKREKFFEKTGRHYDSVEKVVRELAEDMKEGEDR